MLIKSFKDECLGLLKNKMNILVLFIMPLLCVILLGTELSGELISNIPMAVIDHDGTTFSRELTEAFDDNEDFNIVYYPESEEELEKLIKNSKVRVGLIIPKNFYNDITLLKSPTVMMIYDGSHMSITSAAKTKATEILLTYKAGAAIKQLTARLGLSFNEAYNIAQAIKFSTRTLYNPTKSFSNFLAPVLLAGYIQAALALVVTVSVDHNIYSEDRKKRLGYATGKVLFYTMCGTISYMVCITFQVMLFNMPFVGSMMHALILSIALSFAVSAFCVLISALIKNKIVALIGGAVIFIPNSAMAGTTWPLLSMPTGYQSFASIMPFTHYANNIRYVYLKGMSFPQIAGDIMYMIAFGAVWLVLTELVMFIADKKTDSKEVEDDDLSGSLQERIPFNI